MPNKLDDAIAKAGKAAPAKPRRIKPMSKRGRPQSDTSPAVSPPVHGPSELAEILGYQRDAIYEWEKQGLERAPGGKGFHLPIVVRWLMARERTTGRMEADPDDALQAELLRDKRAVADMREDERDKRRKELIQVEIARAVYDDDSAYVAVHLRGMGPRLMGEPALEESPDAISDRIEAEIEIALQHLNSDHVDPSHPNCHPYLGGTGIPGRG